MYDIYELRFQIRDLGDPLLLEPRQPLGGLLHRRLRVRQSGLCLRGALDLQVALDLERAQVADERARFSGKPLGLALKRGNAVVDAARLGFRARPIGRLCREASGRPQQQRAQDEPSHVPSIKSLR